MEGRIKNIAVLGATGSIGRQTLDIISRCPERYKATVLSAGSRVDDLIEASRRFRPRVAVIAREDLLPKLMQALEPLGIECRAGENALAECVEGDDVDMVLTATVGYSGLMPTIRAIAADKDIALANKETLVVAGDLITELLKSSKSRIYPVDSEHSAIAQCLAGEDTRTIRRLLITASGGPFRTWSKEQIETATPADALRHPNWNMGAKITIDSAGMVNKAFEIIEAKHLFGVDASQIKAVIHPQSIVHSMIEFNDGAIKAQLGVPDMRLPIAYALGEHTRLDHATKPLTIDSLASLTFENIDSDRFPAINLAYEALEKGGTFACTYNAANEVAVKAFLQERITFGAIYRIIRATLDRASFIANPTLEDYVASNSESRAIAEEILKTKF
ncbi:MAG: 1-deoxy-D-xylulose-5-phosphate reductoisomerase [Muribaculaceae bacterium]|nr:1-deoxy-D-xylulose-5-phosphate reductoisomerase [Muribaculaceae bacterium]